MSTVGKKTIKNTYIWSLNIKLVKKTNHKRNQNIHRSDENEHNNPKPNGFSKSSAKRKVHSNTSLSLETREK